MTTWPLYDKIPLSLSQMEEYAMFDHSPLISVQQRMSQSLIDPYHVITFVQVKSKF